MYKQLLGTLLSILLLAGCEAFDATSNSDRDDDNNSEPRDTTTTPTITPQVPAEHLNSQIFRDKGTKVYKHSEVSKLSIAGELPNTLHLIPSKTLDDQTRTDRPSPNPSDCGEGTSIKARINDCASKNSTNSRAYLWDGQVNGLSGEGDWMLVATKDSKSIWMDARTELIWSAPITEANWNQASGNISESDQICNASVLPESSERFLGISSEEVVWRLPTRGDYLQADINGSRFVLSTELEGDSNIYWTANYIPEDSQAWAIRHNTGELIKRADTDLLPVRCVGVVLK
ncbi:MAG: hypothetical protein KC478_15180 [Bacteriovoracaceae bacterium]|nr:hypothetical protein [Bacteriovoracaceae bacterium]